jgi:two-component system cell cycle sensor histidine kinase/response regulator CckA
MVTGRKVKLKNSNYLRTEELETANRELEHEIAERRRAEEKLLESEERYKRLLESVTDYIYTVKVENGIPVATSHGEGSAALTGYSPDEYSEDPYLWYRMIHESDRASVSEQSGKVLSGEIVPAIEHRILHKDGSIRWVRNKSVPRYDKDGRLVAYDGLISDITEKKRIEEQLYQSQKMESIGRLAGGVAHDFNNYLTAIIGFSEILMRKFKPEDAQFKILQKISSSAMKAAEVTRQLLTFSRKQIIEPRVLNLNDCIGDVRKMLERLIGEDVQLVTLLAPDIGSVRADPSQVEQIIINLAVNARDAMPQGGKLTIETANCGFDDETAAKYAGIPGGRYVLLSISDTGTGIPDGTIPFIFEPFFTTKEKDRGTGLGLSTVYGIVEQHKGKVVVASEEGKGSTFTICLPRVDEKVKETEADPDVKTLPSGSETILVVEDEEVVREYAVQTLQMQGYTVIEAADGRDALSLCSSRERPVDLVMTDVVMPNMSGRELIEQLRAVWKDCKILCMSGYTEDFIGSRWFPSEDVSFIKKPFNTLTLLNKVREVLDKPGG